MHVERLRLGEPYFLMATGHQHRQHRQLVGKEIGGLQSLGVEVEDIPLTCAGGYQLLVIRTENSEITVDSE